MANLILASSSPRRRELLAMAGYHFTVDSPNVDETCLLPPKEAVVEVARRKAVACSTHHPGDVILAADTMVMLDGKAMGKPASPSDAEQMLQALSGRDHLTCTGVCVMDARGAQSTLVCETTVSFAPMTQRDIRWYVATGEPMDKAGAYAIQGAAAQWITAIQGSHTNVIGLPLAQVRKLLAAAGIMPEGHHHQ